LTRPVAPKGFEAVPRRVPEVVQSFGLIDGAELAPRRVLNVGRERRRIVAKKDSLGLFALEMPDHLV
jgi:hypothetical protein